MPPTYRETQPVSIQQHADALRCGCGVGEIRDDGARRLIRGRCEGRSREIREGLRVSDAVGQQGRDELSRGALDRGAEADPARGDVERVGDVEENLADQPAPDLREHRALRGIPERGQRHDLGGVGRRFQGLGDRDGRADRGRADGAGGRLAFCGR